MRIVAGSTVHDLAAAPDHVITDGCQAGSLASWVVAALTGAFLPFPQWNEGWHHNVARVAIDVVAGVVRRVQRRPDTRHAKRREPEQQSRTM